MVIAMDRIVSPRCPHSYVDILILKVLVLGSGSFGRRLYLDEVIKGSP